MNSAYTTIFALATPQGRGAVQIIRISGALAKTFLQELIGFAPKPRYAHFVSVTIENATVDQGLALFFPGPASATGEDLAELHLHGNPLLAHYIFTWLENKDNCRLAEPGEFTRRSFLNGKIGLDQAEGVADLIDADTSKQHQQAMRQLGGATSRKTELWRQNIITYSAQLEALIDFADEDLPRDIEDSLNNGINALLLAMREELRASRHGIMRRDGIIIAIIGRPNAGKSTLLNHLVGDERAIVSNEAGTTRDLVKVSLDMDGFAVHLVDTAGLRHDEDVIGIVEKEGVKRAISTAIEADIILLLLDASDENVSITNARLQQDLENAFMKIHSHDYKENMRRPEILTVLTKADLLAAPISFPHGCLISVLENLGMEELNNLLQKTIKSLIPPDEAPILTRHRHITAVQMAIEALERAKTNNVTTTPELMAEEMRVAVNALGRITGRIDIEDVLDQIFVSFCIGK